MRNERRCRKRYVPWCSGGLTCLPIAGRDTVSVLSSAKTASSDFFQSSSCNIIAPVLRSPVLPTQQWAPTTRNPFPRSSNMYSLRELRSAAPMASGLVCRPSDDSGTRTDKFARSDHPVRFSNELVDSIQKNTFVSFLPISVRQCDSG